MSKRDAMSGSPSINSGNVTPESAFQVSLEPAMPWTNTMQNARMVLRSGYDSVSGRRVRLVLGLMGQLRRAEIRVRLVSKTSTSAMFVLAVDRQHIERNEMRPVAPEQQLVEHRAAIGREADDVAIEHARHAAH